MRIAILLIVPALLSAAKLPEPYESIADLAASAPPELTADALLRIVESGQLADRNSRKQLVEQSFQNAASTKFQVRMQGLHGTTTDTASGSLSSAYSLKLDALSLESRAVQDMLPLDQAKARDLFTQIANPTLAPLTCDDALVYEPSAYYLALSAVVNGAFTPKERAKEEHVNLLLDSLGQATSPSQLAPLAAAIESAAVTATQKQLLLAHFNGMIDAMRPDDRSFGAAPEQYHLKGHACDAGPKLDPYWKSATAKQLLDAGTKLRFRSSTQLLTESDRATPAWQQQLTDYLSLIADWTPDQGETDAIYYHEKCLVYTALLDLVPAGPQFDKILSDFTKFIQNSDLYQQSPAEWFVEPRTVLDRAQNDAAREQILDAYQRSGNPALMLTTVLEKVFRRT